MPDPDYHRLTPAQRLEREIPVLGATDGEIQTLFEPSRRRAEALKDVFAGIETVILFIGYPRSGHSVVGALLDAHRDMVIAHELDVVGFVDAGFDEDQIYCLLMENARLCAANGRRWGRYAYAVPGGRHGGFDRLRVIGDNNGGLTTVHIALKGELLDRVLKVFTRPVKLIHVVRNPFDNIARMQDEKDVLGGLETASKDYFNLCKVNRAIGERLGPGNVHDLRHEDLLTDPRGELGRLCRFLGVDADDAYLDACSSILYHAPKKSRHAVDWPRRALDAVAAEMEKYPFLRRYSFDD